MGTTSSREDAVEDALDQEDFPTPIESRFGPFVDDPGCGHMYSGIETFCGKESTHYTEFEHSDSRIRMYRCDEHGFPWIVRERQRQVLGRPVLCELCPQFRGVFPLAAQDVEYTAELPVDDGKDDERPFHFCQECREMLRDDIDVEEVSESVDDIGGASRTV